METSCQIAFEFVDQEQLVSYGCVQGPHASTRALPRVGVCGSVKAAETLELGRVWV